MGYVRHVGPHAGGDAPFPGLLGRLGQWAGPRGLIGKDSRWLALYHEGPNLTAPEKLGISLPDGSTRHPRRAGREREGDPGRAPVEPP